MNKIKAVVLFFSIVVYAKSNPVTFTSQSEQILNLEAELAYCYGIANPSMAAEPYMKAIQRLEQSQKPLNRESLQKEMLPLLEQAYTEIRKQRAFSFDVKKAALYEFDLILAQAERASFESICNIMVDLYGEVFQTRSATIEKAAMLRTFLYQYKIKLLSHNSTLSNADIELLKALGKRSESELNTVK